MNLRNFFAELKRRHVYKVAIAYGFCGPAAHADCHSGLIYEVTFRMRRFFSELKRRKVYRVAIAYAVAAWLVAQVVTQIFPVFEVSPWALRSMIVLLITGFPIALILAWAFDITPEGIKRTNHVDLTQAQARRVEAIPVKSIAVLPFENLSDDPENAYFADGVHDDILSSLSKISDLKVISRTSVRQYKEGARNLREIGQALGVAHILEGTVRRAGNRVRVNAQLINAQTDAHIWGDTFDRELKNLFALQSELAERITEALRVNLSAQERASMQIHPTSDLAAYELFLRARDLFRWSGLRAINTATPNAWLIAIQTYRFAGIMFVYPFVMYGILPTGFGYPAGIGDALTGIFAPFVALMVAQNRPHAWKWAMAWNLFGILDLIVAPATALIFQARVLNIYPLALVPLFLGPPLGILTHVLSLRNLAVTRIAEPAKA
jgi:TolB-like protein